MKHEFVYERLQVLDIAKNMQLDDIRFAFIHKLPQHELTDLCEAYETLLCDSIHELQLCKRDVGKSNLVVKIDELITYYATEYRDISEQKDMGLVPTIYTMGISKWPESI